MAAKSKRKSARRAAGSSLLRTVRRGVRRVFLAALALVLLAVALYRVVNPPITHTIWAEQRRLGAIDQTWVPLEAIAPVMARSAVAAEDANFCTHWGFDMNAIRDAIADGAARGGSTISQQTVKNVYLWQERSWLRKGLEAALTPLVEAAWPKRRILEVYLNVAEFGEGVFGIEAAARATFGVSAADLTPAQAARLAAVLPNPRARDPARLSPALQRRAAAIADGAATIDADGRAECFQNPPA
jgi:monofunctional biosynthetic peptidoglycan transglycosylase